MEEGIQDPVDHLDVAVLQGIKVPKGDSGRSGIASAITIRGALSAYLGSEEGSQDPVDLGSEEGSQDPVDLGSEEGSLLWQLNYFRRTSEMY